MNEKATETAINKSGLYLTGVCDHFRFRTAYRTR